MVSFVLSCKLGGSHEQREIEERVADLLSAQGHRVLTSPDLYHLPEDSPMWARLAALRPPVVYAGWQPPRALKWLLHKHGVEAANCANLGDYATAAEAATALEHLRAAEEAPAHACVAAAHTDEASGESGAAERWYPVMDLSRCTNCGNCFQFCLFGVYEKDAQGQVTVAQPDNCKPGCPACARICPSSAIMFPLHSQDPAVSGAPGCYVVVDEEAAAMFRERVQGRRAAAPAVLDEIDSLIDELKGLSDGGDA